MNKLGAWRDKTAANNGDNQHDDGRAEIPTKNGAMETLATERSASADPIQPGDGGSKPKTIVERLSRVLNRRKLKSDADADRAAPSDSRLVAAERDVRLQSARRLMRQQLHSINSIASVKVKSILSIAFLVNMFTAACLVQAAFWTFYMPNFLKPNGYKELSEIIGRLEDKINATKDAFSDHQHFWGLLRKMDSVDESALYPEESVCLEIFPLFRELAIEYSYIDYEHFLKPMQAYHEHLLKCRAKWYPEGRTTKNVLPREWEQNLYEFELDHKIRWLSKLAETEEYRERRAKMVRIWQDVSRGLDTSLKCVYLRYAYRQIAGDINQFALDMNLKYMREAAGMLKSAYPRIAKLKGEEARAKQSIADAITKDERFNIKS